MTLTGELLEGIDDQHYRWTLICPACLINFSGTICKTGWLQLDAICPGCQRVVAGFTNPPWPPAPTDVEVLEAQRMLRAGR